MAHASTQPFPAGLQAEPGSASPLGEDARFLAFFNEPLPPLDAGGSGEILRCCGLVFNAVCSQGSWKWRYKC